MTAASRCLDHFIVHAVEASCSAVRQLLESVECLFDAGAACVNARAVQQ
jgi:hypothetical protein